MSRACHTVLWVKMLATKPDKPGLNLWDLHGRSRVATPVNLDKAAHMHVYIYIDKINKF